MTHLTPSSDVIAGVVTNWSILSLWILSLFDCPAFCLPEAKLPETAENARITVVKSRSTPYIDLVAHSGMTVFGWKHAVY
jgi:hypothetical protein